MIVTEPRNEKTWKLLVLLLFVVGCGAEVFETMSSKKDAKQKTEEVLEKWPMDR